MHASSIIYVVSALAAAAYAQDASSSSAATMSGTATSDALTGRESLVTIVTSDIVVYTSTDTGNSVFVTTLPKSLRTFETTVPVSTALIPLYSTSIVNGVSTVVNTIPTGSSTATLVGSSTLSDMAQSTSMSSATSATDAAGASSTMSSAAGAAGTALPYALAGIFAGVAAIL